MGEEQWKQIEKDIQGKAKKYFIKGMNAEDIRQELCLVVLERYSRFNPEIASFRSWANKVMQDRIKDLIKKKRVECVSLEGADRLSYQRWALNNNNEAQISY